MDPFTRFFTFRLPYRSDRAILRLRCVRHISVLALLSLITVACGAVDGDDADAAEDVVAETTVAEGDQSPDDEAGESAGEGTDEQAEPENDAAVDAETEADVETLFPDVVGVEAQQADDGTWRFDVTLSSPYDSPERYADAWRVVGPDGTVYGERVLLHDHANEQPFTRSQSGIEIPAGVTEVSVEGRDQVSGWGGAIVTFTLP